MRASVCVWCAFDVYFFIDGSIDWGIRSSAGHDHTTPRRGVKFSLRNLCLVSVLSKALPSTTSKNREKHVRKFQSFFHFTPAKYQPCPLNVLTSPLPPPRPALPRRQPHVSSTNHINQIRTPPASRTTSSRPRGRRGGGGTRASTRPRPQT